MIQTMFRNGAITTIPVATTTTTASFRCLALHAALHVPGDFLAKVFSLRVQLPEKNGIISTASVFGNKFPWIPPIAVRVVDLPIIIDVD